MKKILIIASLVLAILLTLFYLLVYPRFLIISGYAAKNMCSCVFVAGIDQEKVINEDLNFNIISLAKIEVDYDRKSVTASVYGLNPKTAYYQGPTGCTLVKKLAKEEAYKYRAKWNTSRHDSLDNWFTYIDTIEYLTSAQVAKIAEAIDKAFTEEDPPQPKKNTRAALVLHKGQLIGERYATGFDQNSRLMGWSMTKSLTATMLGLLVDDGQINLNEPTGIAAWQVDERKDITWKHLINMNSGLHWAEVYDKVSDAVIMLFNSDAIGQYAMQLPLDFEPETTWTYSSGTTNIIASKMADNFQSKDEYIRFIYDRFFDRIGAYSMVMETDAIGNYVGSSYSWATTRDWAKIGQFYLQKGNWAGEQILSEQWVDFIQQPAKGSDGIYGGHFWLNKGGRYPDLPQDLYSMDGFHGQKVFIIPSKELVVVRLGLTYTQGDFDFNQWLKEIIEIIDKA